MTFPSEDAMIFEKQEMHGSDDRMELRSLYCFLMVAREENITHAAEQLHVTQPTLSRTLMQLEEEIGAQLIIRGKRRIQLTEAGMILRRRAEEILDMVDKTEQEIISDEKNLAGNISIGTAECLAAHKFLPGILTAFSSEYSQVTYDLYTGNADLIKERLDQGLIDVGILLEPVDMEKYDFVRLPYKERWGVLVNRDSELALKKYITPEDLLGIPLINTKRSIVQKEIAGWSKDYYDKLHFVATYNLLTNAVSLVENGLGSVITIKGAFYNHAARQVKFVPFYPALTTGTVLVWKKNQALPRITQKFVEYIYERLSGKGQ